MPSSTVENPGMEWPPPRTASGSPSLRARSTVRITSATPAHRAITAGRRSWAPFQMLRSLVVVRVARPDGGAAQAGGELGEGGLPDAGSVRSRSWS